MVHQHCLFQCGCCLIYCSIIGSRKTYRFKFFVLDFYRSGSYISFLTAYKLFYFIFCNLTLTTFFYIINLVFLLQLLHISNRVTLIALTFVLSVFIWSRVQNVSLKHTAVKIGVSNRKVIQGKLGIRTALRNIMRRIRRQAHAVWQYIYRGMICKPFQWLHLPQKFTGFVYYYAVFLIGNALSVR